VPAVIALLIAGAVVAAVAISGGGTGPDGRDGPAPAATTASAARLQGVAVGGRPNGVAIAGGDAYVTIPGAERLRQIDLDRFDRARPGPRVGRGAFDIDSGYGSLWVTTATDRERLTRIDLATGLRTVRGLPDGEPVAVEAGENAVWVGIRGARFRSTPTPKVVRIDPRTMEVVRTIEVPRGVQDMAVGGGAVWVTNRATDSVTRIDVRTGAQQVVTVGRGPSGLAIGSGSVWTANGEESTVTRIDRQTHRSSATVSVPGQPRFAAFGGGDVWVSTFASSTLVRIDGDTGRAAGDPIDVALNPTKVTVSRGAVYVVSTAGGRLERLRFGPAG
jgi:streptogramin lyase